MTTLISIEVREGLALFSDSSITYPPESGKAVEAGEVKLFKFHTLNEMEFVLQIMGNLDFPSRALRENPISKWIDEMIKDTANRVFESVEEFSESLNRSFVSQWNSLSTETRFQPVTFWVSGKNAKKRLSTLSLYYEKDLKHPTKIENRNNKIYSILKLPLFIAPNCAHWILKRFLWGDLKTQTSTSFNMNLEIDSELFDLNREAILLSQINRSGPITYVQACKRSEIALKIIEIHGKFLGCRELQSAARLPMSNCLISK